MKEYTPFEKFLFKCVREVKGTGFEPKYWSRPVDDLRRDVAESLIIEGKGKEKTLYFAFCDDKQGRPFTSMHDARIYARVLGKMMSASCESIQLPKEEKKEEVIPLPAPIPKPAPKQVQLPLVDKELPPAPAPIPTPLIEPVLPLNEYKELHPVQWWTTKDAWDTGANADAFPLMILVNTVDKNDKTRQIYLARQRATSHFASFAIGREAIDWAGLNGESVTSLFVNGVPNFPHAEPANPGIKEELKKTLVAQGKDQYAKAMAVRHAYAAAAERLAKEIEEKRNPPIREKTYWSLAGEKPSAMNALEHIRAYSGTVVPRPLRWKYIQTELDHVKYLTVPATNEEQLALLSVALRKFAEWLRKPLDEGEDLR